MSAHRMTPRTDPAMRAINFTQTEVIELPEPEPQPLPQRHYLWTDVMIVGLVATAFVAEYAAFHRIDYWPTWWAIRIAAVGMLTAFVTVTACFVKERIGESK